MSLIASTDLDPKRVTRYAHSRSWLMDSHPPYRYHVDNADVSSILGVCWESPWAIWEQMRSQQLSAPRVQRSNQLLKWTPILRRLFESQTARSCDLEWRRIQHSELEWARTHSFLSPLIPMRASMVEYCSLYLHNPIFLQKMVPSSPLGTVTFAGKHCDGGIGHSYAVIFPLLMSPLLSLPIITL